MLSSLKEIIAVLLPSMPIIMSVISLAFPITSKSITKIVDVVTIYKYTVSVFILYVAFPSKGNK